MANFHILTDAVADLPAYWTTDHGYITVVDTPICVSNNQRILTLRHLGPDDFSRVEKFVNDGYRASTSQPEIFDPDESNPETVESLTRKYLRQGKDVIYVAMNSALSGTFNTVTMLYRELQDFATEQGRQLLCVDSRCMSTGLALLFWELDRAIQEHCINTVAQVASFITNLRDHMGHFFTWAKLDYIKRSGRVDAVRAMIANLLHIRLMCSAQYVDADTRKLEHINPHARLRGLASFARALGTYAQRHIVDPTGPIIVAHGNVPRDAELVTTILRDYLPDAQYLTGPAWRCGAGIQCHGGPSSLHINFQTDNIGMLAETTAEMEEIIRNLR